MENVIQGLFALPAAARLFPARTQYTDITDEGEYRS